METDPLFKSFTDENGSWFSCCSNMAIFYPLAELAGFNNVLHIKDVIYIYNVDNPINSEKTNSDLYYNTQDLIQNKKSLLS